MVGSTLHDKRYGLEEEESSKRLGFLFMKVGPDNQKARARWQLGWFQILRNKAKDFMGSVFLGDSDRSLDPTPIPKASIII